MDDFRICGKCGFFKPDCDLEIIGHCMISGNIHFGEDICEAEKEAQKDGSIQSRPE